MNIKQSEILILKDNLCAQVEISGILRKAGFDRVTITQTASEALDSIESNIPSIILLDWVLPDVLGVDFLEILRCKGYSIPVLVITGMPTTDRIISALSLGCVDYITKPLRAEQLLGSICTTLRSPF